jgi:hypothetical protein
MEHEYVRTKDHVSFSVVLIGSIPPPRIANKSLIGCLPFLGINYSSFCVAGREFGYIGNDSKNEEF